MKKSLWSVFFHAFRVLGLGFFCVLVFSVRGFGEERNGNVTLDAGDLLVRDPFIVGDRDAGEYFLYLQNQNWRPAKEQPQLGVDIFVSRDLKTWKFYGPAFQLPADSKVSFVWAPEVHRFNGAYYLFATLTSPASTSLPAPADHPDRRLPLVRRGTWVFRADSPRGPFTPVKQGSLTPEDWLALDGTLWVEDGKPFMVFCHDCTQTVDGTIEMVELKPDLSGTVGTPKTLFRATDAPNALTNPEVDKITDGPFLYRSPTSGNLYMIWSTFLQDSNGYTTLCARSASGKLAGPWVEHTPIYTHDGGHGMIFTTLEGKTMMAIHQPNAGPERLKLLEIHEEGNTLKVTE